VKERTIVAKSGQIFSHTDRCKIKGIRGVRSFLVSLARPFRLAWREALASVLHFASFKLALSQGIKRGIKVADRVVRSTEIPSDMGQLL
jgi:hypothetical protein